MKKQKEVKYKIFNFENLKNIELHVSKKGFVLWVVDSKTKKTDKYLIDGSCLSELKHVLINSKNKKLSLVNIRTQEEIKSEDLLELKLEV